MYVIKPVTVTIRGRQFLRDVLEHPGSAAVLARLGDDTFVFVRQSRPAIDRTTLELPGGRVRNGEPPEEAAAREMEAETGLRPVGLHLLTIFCPAPGYSTEMTSCYLAEGTVPGSMQFDESEEIQLEFLTWEGIQTAISRGEICDARSLIAIHKFGEMRGAPLSPPGRTY